MGKAKIVSHIANSEYNIIYYHDLIKVTNTISKLDAEITSISTQITTKEAELVTLNTEADDNSDDLDDKILLYAACTDAEPIEHESVCSAQKLAVKESNVELLKTYTEIDILVSTISNLNLKLEHIYIYKKRLDTLNGEESKTAWCIDVCDRTIGAPDNDHGEIIPTNSIVGTIDIFDFSARKYNTNIRASSYTRDATYVEAIDGLSGFSLASSPDGFVYNYNMMGPLSTWNPTYRLAIINSISAGVAQITYNTQRDLDGVTFNTMDHLADSDVPVDYMKCSSLPPFKSGDQVVVSFDGDKMATPTIIGYYSNPQVCVLNFPPCGVVFLCKTLEHNYSGVGPIAYKGWEAPYELCSDDSTPPCTLPLTLEPVNGGAGTVTDLGSVIKPKGRIYLTGFEGSTINDIELKHEYGTTDGEPSLDYWPSSSVLDWVGANGKRLSIAGPQNRYGNFSMQRNQVLTLDYYASYSEYPFIFHESVKIGECPEDIRAAFIVTSAAEVVAYPLGSTEWVVGMRIRLRSSTTWTRQSTSRFTFFAKPLDVAIAEGAAYGTLPTDIFNQATFDSLTTDAEKIIEYGKWHETPDTRYDIPYGQFNRYPAPYDFVTLHIPTKQAPVFNQSATEFIMFVDVVTDQNETTFTQTPYICKVLVDTTDIDDISLTPNAEWKQVIDYDPISNTHAIRTWIVGADYINDVYKEAIITQDRIDNSTCSIVYTGNDYVEDREDDVYTELKMEVGTTEVFSFIDTREALISHIMDYNVDYDVLSSSSADYTEAFRLMFLDVRYDLACYGRVRIQTDTTASTHSDYETVLCTSPDRWLKTGSTTYDNTRTFTGTLWDPNHINDREIFETVIEDTHTSTNPSNECSEGPNTPTACSTPSPPLCDELDDFICIWSMTTDYGVVYTGDVFCNLQTFNDIPVNRNEVREFDPDEPTIYGTVTKSTMYSSKAESLGISVGELIGFGTTPLYDDDEVQLYTISVI